MSKLEDARKILLSVGMPQKQQSDICCYTLLAMSDVMKKSKWEDAKNNWIRIHDIIQFAKKYYKVSYAENSRETFRKSALHQFRDAALIEDNGLATNSPKYQYRITEETLSLIRAYGSRNWCSQLESFKSNHESLISKYSSKKETQKMSIIINNEEFRFSTGSHNQLQKAIIEEFAPRFAPSCECLYIGDSTERDLYKNTERIDELGFEITLHDKMPDIVLYCAENKWIYFIEAVTSVGPMNSERVLNIKKMTERTGCGLIFVTAFPNFKTYKKFSEELAWETEVWISDMPDHMIHLNGDKFLGPRY